jgi:hypothetical protein
VLLGSQAQVASGRVAAWSRAYAAAATTEVSRKVFWMSLTSMIDMQLITSWVTVHVFAAYCP